MELLNKLKGYEVMIRFTYGFAKKYFAKDDIYESVDDFVRDCDTTNSIYFNNSKIKIKNGNEEDEFLLCFGSEYDSIEFKLIQIMPFSKSVARELESMF